MIRNINITGLKTRLAYNTGGQYSAKAGEASNNFIIHLKSGRYYQVKRGYNLWWGDGHLRIKEAEFSTRDMVQGREKKGNSILETVFDIGLALLATAANEKTAHEVILEWDEIDNIDRV